MSTDNAAPDGADVSSASSSAPTHAEPESAGLPTKDTLTRSLAAKRAENAKAEQAKPADAKQPNAALGGDGAGKNPEGETAANLQAGKGEDKPTEKKERDGELPPWLKERLGKEKTRREKVEADLTAARTDGAKLKHLYEVAVTENERLLGLLQDAGKLDERGEELNALKVQNEVREHLARIDAEHKVALTKMQREAQTAAITEQLRSEVATVLQEFPLISRPDLIATLRENPGADIRELAQKMHEERSAILSKHGWQRAATTAATGTPAAAPTTVGKPTGTTQNLPPLNAKGMTGAFRAARARP